MKMRLAWALALWLPALGLNAAEPYRLNELLNKDVREQKEAIAFENADSRLNYYLHLFQSVRFWGEPTTDGMTDLPLPEGIRGGILLQSQRAILRERHKDLKKLLGNRVGPFLYDSELTYRDRKTLGEMYLSVFWIIDRFDLNRKRIIQDEISRATTRNYYLSLLGRSSKNAGPFGVMDVPSFSRLAQLENAPLEQAGASEGSFDRLQAIALSLLGKFPYEMLPKDHRAIILALGNRSGRVRSQAASILPRVISRFDLGSNLLLADKLKGHRVQRTLSGIIFSDAKGRGDFIHALHRSRGSELYRSFLGIRRGDRNPLEILCGVQIQDYENHQAEQENAYPFK
jgi:hypothetical protein